MLAVIFSAVGALVTLIFTAISIHGSILAHQFSLPTPLFGHVLAILLPISVFLSLILPSFLPATTTIKTPAITRHQIQTSLLTLLSLLDAALITLASTLLQPDLQTCSLERRWRVLFQAHDVGAIRGIQDALNCCGLRTTLDQPWPWPDHLGAKACRENFGRERSCEQGWKGREARVLAIWVVVGVGGLVFKAMLVLLYRNRPAWFHEDNGHAGRGRYSQGRVIEQDDDRVEGGRYLDQPSEETPLRVAEADPENEPRRVAAG